MTFSQWCEALEAVLGHAIPNADGEDADAVTVHELAAMYERGVSPADAALNLEH